MLTILLVNPNTSQATTEALVAGARGAAGDETEVIGVTAPFGVPLISTPSEGVIGAHATLVAIADKVEGVDAVILGGFRDYGLEAARQLFPVNILGMGESAMRTVLMLGRPFGILTVGRAMVPSMTSMAKDWNVGHLLAGVRVVADMAGGERPTQEELLTRSREIGRELMADDGAEAVLLAGAPLASLAPILISERSVPVIEGICAAVKYAELLHQLGLRPAHSGSTMDVADDQTVGLSKNLALAISRFRSSGHGS